MKTPKTPEQFLSEADLTQKGNDASGTMFYLACELVRMGCSEVEAVEYLSNQYNGRLAASGLETWTESEIRHKVGDARKTTLPDPWKSSWRGQGVVPQAPPKKTEALPVTDEQFVAGVEAALKACGPTQIEALAGRYGLTVETIQKARDSGALGVRPDKPTQPRWIWPGTWQNEVGGQLKRISAKGRIFKGLWLPWEHENPVGLIVCEGAKDALTAAQIMPGWQACAKPSVSSKVKVTWFRKWEGLPAIIALDHGAREESIVHLRTALLEAGLRPRVQKWDFRGGIADNYDVHDAFLEVGADAVARMFGDTLGQVVQAAPPSETHLKQHPTDDRGNALCYAAQNSGRLHYSKSIGWALYSGVAWRTKHEEAPLRAEMADMLKARQDLGLKCSPNMCYVSAALSLAQGYLWRSYEEFDGPDTLHLLPTPNGTINLRTGECRPNDPTQLICAAAATPWNPKADPKPWHEFVSTLCGAETADWLQVAMGYAITGYASEEFLVYLVGPRRSGKGTFQTAILNTIGGPTCQEIGFESLTRDRNRGDQGFDLARLHAARIVFASESDDRTALNQSMLKRISGGDGITCSYKGLDQFTYKPKFTAVVASNDPPIISPDDMAAWGRIRLVQFPTSHFGKEDAALKERFRTEEWRQTILAWLVEGARRWFAEYHDAGRTMADINTALKEDIRLEQDPIGQWISERCAVDRALSGQQYGLYEDWQFWAHKFGQCPVSSKKFGMILTKKGYEKVRGRDGYVVIGLDTRWSEPNYGYGEEAGQEGNNAPLHRAAARAHEEQDSFL